MVKHAFEVVSKAIKVGGAVVPADRGSTSVTTSAFDRSGFSELVCCVQTGAASGSPTAIALSVEVEHSDSQTGTFTSAFTSSTVVSAANSSGFVGVDLSGMKRFVRAKLVVSLTGGASPTVGSSMLALLAGSEKIPVS